MSQVALVATIGTPTTVAVVPITTSGLTPLITASQAAAAAADTAADMAKTDATTADTAAGTAVTNITTVQTNIATATTNAGTVTTDINTCLTDHDAAAAAFIAACVIIDRLGTLAYDIPTHQMSGSSIFGQGPASQTTSTDPFVAAMNATATALIATKAAQVTAVAALGTCTTNVATALTQANTVKTDTATTKTDATAAKAATATAKTAADNVVLGGGSDVLVQFDTAEAASTSILSGAFKAVLAYVRNAAILPP